jgi:hypothetical protein
MAYPWGEPGPLEKFDGPDKWQREQLEAVGRAVHERGFTGLKPVAPIRDATASGHGTGKSTQAAWLVNWIMSTRQGAQGTVTANTVTQLQTKTWPTIQKWTKLCATAHWFRMTSRAMRRIGEEESWFCTAQTAKPENSEAFAGQHASDSTSFYIFDEGSAVPDKLWEVAEGGLTDGEPMIFAFGNPTRSNGKFHRVVFGSERNLWTHRSIDSRTSRFTNQALIAEWLQQYGEDSDFFRVRVRGLAPRASDLQYIDSDRVYEAQKRLAHHLKDDPLIVGLDVARGGAANTVFRFRRGLDAASIPSQRISGEDSRDSMVIVTKLLDIMGQRFGGVKPAAAFVDSGFGGAVVDRCRQLGHTNIIEIRFGAGAPDAHFANMRSWMWSKAREFLEHGSIDQDPRLETDLTGPGFRMNGRDQVVLESKEDMEKRGLASPDDGDALALTFAQPVLPPEEQLEEEESESIYGNRQGGWMG